MEHVQLFQNYIPAVNKNVFSFRRIFLKAMFIKYLSYILHLNHIFPFELYFWIWILIGLLSDFGIVFIILIFIKVDAYNLFLLFFETKC